MFSLGQFGILFIISILIAIPTSGQNQIDLFPYSNDTLGFSIELPCAPEWIPKDSRGVGGMLVCQKTFPAVIILVQEHRGNKAIDLDAFIKREIQVDAPMSIKKRKVGGYKSREISFNAGGSTMKVLLVIREYRVYMFTLVLPDGDFRKLDPGILNSIDFF